MKILIIRSVKKPSTGTIDYCRQFDTKYADRVIGNLRNETGFCASCADACAHCRATYNRNFSPYLHVADFPAMLPPIIENPVVYIPPNLPRHDILLAIHIHGQILIEVLKRCPDFGTRAVIVPIENPDWVSGSTMTEAEKLCEANKVETAFPKPFCSFDPPKGTVLSEFRKRFHVGLPEVELRVEDRVIKDARVEVSAPCGATYYVARGLVGRNISDDLKVEVIAKRLSSYPCTASTKRDRQLGDSIIHHANLCHFKMLRTRSVAL